MGSHRLFMPIIPTTAVLQRADTKRQHAQKEVSAQERILITLWRYTLLLASGEAS